MKIHKQGKKSTLLVSHHSRQAFLQKFQIDVWPMQHPDLAEVISNIVDLPQDELPHYLANISTWMWPRSDLHSWVKVLNKFDEILKGFVEEYELDKLQLNPFTPLTKSIIMEILRFETLLLDNSTNRKLFASYDVSNHF
jgi:E3 ubiquitin-protein ligase HUWE1